MNVGQFHARFPARSRIGLFGLALFGLSSVVIGACGTRRGFEEDRNDGFVPVEAGAPCSDVKCSRDLKSVIKVCEDGREETVQTCTGDLGCGAGTCVDACESARLSKGSIGCSFWTLPPDDERYGRGACFVAMIANTWTRPLTIKAELGAEAIDITKATYIATKNGNDTTYAPLTSPLPPGEVALVFLSQEDRPNSSTFTRCPATVTPAYVGDPIIHGTAKTRAFHLITDAPASAYSIFPYGGATSYYPTATLLLPESSWEPSYVAVSTARLQRFGRPGMESRTLQVVASQDDTTVEIRPTVAIAQGVDVAPALRGQTQSWTLSRGQVLQISQSEDASGSPIVANKPVALFGGSSCAFLPGELEFCDLTQQQIAPFSQWGTSYALVPYKTRIESLSASGASLPTPELVPWSFVGAVDGTALSYDPERPLGAPETLAAGEVVSFFTDRLVSVKSQDGAHPFHAAVYMTGSKFNGGSGVPQSGPFGPLRPSTLGDPDFVNVVPTEQFLDRYVFFTDHTYPETSLTIVRRKTASGFKPVELACLGEVGDFLPLGTTGEYEYTWVTLTTGYTARQTQRGSCGYGRHEAKSEGPFSVTVWGIGTDASYGYPGGSGSRLVNTGTPPPIR